LFGFENGGCYWSETTMRDDAELLREYTEERSEEAFAELVRRHLGLVYNAALRQVGGDAHLAQDVAQSVFADLARKAGALSGRAVLAGWLYTSTRYAAVQVVRSEQRRRRREDAVMRLSEQASTDGGTAEWERLRPVIDDALHALGERDREAVLLRFFEGRAFAEVGATLAVSEDAARMRVERALERLRGLLVRRGVTSTSAALAVALSGQAMAAVPAGLAVSVTGAVLTSGAAATAGAAGWVTFMGMTKLQIGLAGVILAGGAAGFFAQKNADAALRREREEVAARQVELRKVREEQRERLRVAAAVRELRKDDVEFARLETEAEVLKRELAANVAARARLQTPLRDTAEGKRVFKLAELDVVPKAVSQTRPKFPGEMRSSGLEGIVTVRFLVGDDGKVKSAEAVKASHEAFADSATEAVKGWVFEPGKKASMPVNVQMTVPIVYTLNREDGDANNWF
jgi:RNA polymerase sigma factor (sigma-70 family)